MVLKVDIVIRVVWFRLLKGRLLRVLGFVVLVGVGVLMFS